MSTVAWAAPGRLNLIGEHTDYNDGFVLPLALPFVTTATVGLRTDGDLLIRSAQRPGEEVRVPLADLRPGAVPGWAAYPAGSVWAIGGTGPPRDAATGLDLAIDGGVPEGGGLSSSAALECAVVAAVNDLLGLGLPAIRLAALARQAENEFVGVPTGVMDQLASMLCRPGSALFIDTRSLDTEPVPLDLAAHGLALLCVDTRTPHQLAGGEYASRRRDCELAAAELGVRALRDVPSAYLDVALAELTDEVRRRRVRHVVTENERVLRVVGLLRAGRPADIGPLLTASHVSLRDDYEVTVPQLDTAVDAALAAGALGARMTGGGFGGCVLALVRSGVDAQRAVRDEIDARYAERGFTPPSYFPGTPSAGARRLP